MTNLRKQKKAQIEVSFNWIFVLIAGAAILFFFIRVIDSEMDFGREATLSRAVNRMNSVMTALAQNPDSVSMQDRINYQIQFYCTIEGHSYGIEGARATQSLPHQLIFSPEIIGNSKLIAWVKTYDAPFPVGSMLYLTDEATQYVFIEDENPQKMRQYFELFPNNISKILTTLDEFTAKGDQGYERYILIILEDAVEQGFSLGAGNARFAAKIPYIVSIDEPNEINFYEFGEYNTLLLSNRENRGYFTQEQKIGAIITGHPDLYDCTMNKALEQTRITANINEARIQLLHDAYPEAHSCKQMYSLISQNLFIDMANSAKNEDFENLNAKYASIRSLNNQMLRTGCVTIY